MAKKFSELRAKMSPEAQRESRRMADQMIAEMPLDELRTARRLTQEQLAAELGVKQAAVSKLERKADLYVSTLRRFIEAAGGELEIRANFPDGSVIKVVQFSDAGEER